MNILNAESWVPNWETHPSWTHVIDLRSCHGHDEIVKAFAAVLHGSDSLMGGMENAPNLNWLADVASDWAHENWGKKKTILVAGASNLVKVSPRFAMDIVDILNSIFMSAVREQLIMSSEVSTSAEEIILEIDETTIFIILN